MHNWEHTEFSFNNNNNNMNIGHTKEQVYMKEKRYIKIDSYVLVHPLK